MNGVPAAFTATRPSTLASQRARGFDMASLRRGSRRVMKGAFLFFLIKGLLWLLAPAALLLFR